MSVTREELGHRSVRLYIDHLDNEDGLVWAVDCPKDVHMKRRYVRASKVVTYTVMATVHRRGKRQPRAWLETFGAVTVLTHSSGAVVVTIR